MLKKYVMFVVCFLITANCISLAAEDSQPMDASKRGDIIQHSKEAIEVSENERIRRKLEWLSDLKFGALVCWGPSVEWDGNQSWFLCPDATSWACPDTFKPWIRYNKDLEAMSAAYWDVYKQFDPKEFDAEKLIQTIKQAGMRYAGLTTKHHDGFCLFDTMTTDFKITSRQCPYASNPKADIAAAFYEAMNKAEIGTLFYFSKSDWHTPYYWNPQFPVINRNINYDAAKHPELWNKFKEYTYRQIEELMTNYGNVDILWLDGGQVRPPRMDIDMDKIADMTRKHNPGAIIVDRTVGGKYENYITPEQYVPTRPVSGIMWETCKTISTHGWIHRNNAEYLPANELLHMLIRVVSDGGNLLLGFGPDSQGRLAPEVEERLAVMGAWLDVNGEGIYETRRGDFVKNRANENIVYTLSKDGLYAYMHLLAWPEGELEVNDPVSIKAGSAITMLPGKTPLKWQLKEGRLIVDFDGIEKPCKHAWALKIVVASD